jgi:hypothetical protein
MRVQKITHLVNRFTSVEYIYNNFFKSLLSYVLFGTPRIFESRHSRLALQGVEEGSITSTVALPVVKGDGQCQGYNWPTLFLRDINTGTWAAGWGSLESETVKCGHESCGTRT